MKRTTTPIRAIGAMLLTAGMIPALIGCSTSDPASESDLVVWDAGLLSKVNEDGSPDEAKSFMHTIIKQFEAENEGIKIELVQQSGDISANSAQFQAAAIAGDGPDVRVQYAGGPTISQAEFFTDLEPLLDPELFDKLTGFNVNRENYDPEGRLVGMPFGGGNMFTVFANNKVLEEAGIDPSVTPKSWEDLLANAKQVGEKTDKFGFATGNLEGYVGAWVITALAGGELGENAFTEMYSGALPLDSPGMVKAYQAFADWGASGVTNPDAGQLSAGDATSLFYKGEAAYIISGSWENNVVLENLGEDGASVYLIPALKGAAHPNIGAGGPEIAVSITESSTHKELAAEFINFMAKASSQDTFVTIAQSQSANHADSDPSKIKNPFLKKEFEDVGKATDGITFGFDSVVPQATADLFYRLNSSVFIGAVTPEDAVKQLSDSLKQELAQK